ncbi:hypothetical protein Pfo_025713 [Paulownia fortunei]|nr:hypothetical protein Pfo_025713 [Paulownia fortunei]
MSYTFSTILFPRESEGREKGRFHHPSPRAEGGGIGSPLSISHLSPCRQGCEHAYQHGKKFYLASLRSRKYPESSSTPSCPPSRSNVPLSKANVNHSGKTSSGSSKSLVVQDGGCTGDDRVEAWHKRPLDSSHGEKLKFKDKEMNKLVESQQTLEEKYEVEVATGRKFLARKEGKIHTAELEKEAVAKFLNFPVFDKAAMTWALTLYDDIVRDYRFMLRESGRITEDIVMLIEPRVLELDRDIVDENPPPTLVGVYEGDPSAKIVDAVAP